MINYLSDDVGFQMIRQKFTIGGLEVFFSQNQRHVLQDLRMTCCVHAGSGTGAPEPSKRDCSTYQGQESLTSIPNCGKNSLSLN